MGKVEDYLIKEANEYVGYDEIAIEEFEKLAKVKNVTDLKVLKVEIPDEMEAARWEHDESSVAVVIPVVVEYTTSTGKKGTKEVPFSFGLFAPEDTLTVEDLEHVASRPKTRPFALGFDAMRMWY